MPRPTTKPPVVRPFTRDLAGCVLSDGTLLFVTGEDFGKTYGEIITKGATFTFDADTLSFRAHPPLPGCTYPRHLIPLSDKKALLLSHWSLWDGEGWTKAAGKQPRVGEWGSVMRRLSDGSYLVYGDSEEILCIQNGEVSVLGRFPKAREYDGLVELPNGDLWFGAGNTKEGYSTKTPTETLLWERKKASWTKGPVLPGAPRRGALFPVGEGRPLYRHREPALPLGWRRLESAGNGAALTNSERALPALGCQPNRLRPSGWYAPSNQRREL